MIKGPAVAGVLSAFPNNLELIGFTDLKTGRTSKERCSSWGSCNNHNSEGAMNKQMIQIRGLQLQSNDPETTKES